MNNIQNLSSVIITKVSGVGGLHSVYDYEPDKPASGKYPFAVVSYTGIPDASFGDTVRNIRTYGFSIKIYQERTSIGFGNEKAERVIREICDEIVNAFDNDTTLSGSCLFVRPITGSNDYEDREVGDTRVAQFDLNCVTVVDSIT